MSSRRSAPARRGIADANAEIIRRVAEAPHRRVQVAVDQDGVDLLMVGDVETWAAAGHKGGVALRISSKGVAISKVELERVEPADRLRARLSCRVMARGHDSRAASTRAAAEDRRARPARGSSAIGTWPQRGSVSQRVCGGSSSAVRWRLSSALSLSP